MPWTGQEDICRVLWTDFCVPNWDKRESGRSVSQVGTERDLIEVCPKLGQKEIWQERVPDWDTEGGEKHSRKNRYRPSI